MGCSCDTCTATPGSELAEQHRQRRREFALLVAERPDPRVRPLSMMRRLHFIAQEFDARQSPGSRREAAHGGMPLHPASHR